MPVVVRRPAPPLDGVVTAITYRAGEQSCTSVEKILPGPEAGLWVNLNRDEFRSFGDTGRVNRAPGAMIAGPTSRASVIEFEAGHAHVSVAFALGAVRCFVASPVDLMRNDLVPLETLWGRSGGCLRERLLEAQTPEDALSVMKDVLLRQMTGLPGPDPSVIAAARHGYADQPHLADEFRELADVTPAEYLRSRVDGPNHLRFPSGECEKMPERVG